MKSTIRLKRVFTTFEHREKVELHLPLFNRTAKRDNKLLITGKKTATFFKNRDNLEVFYCSSNSE